MELATRCRTAYRECPRYKTKDVLGGWGADRPEPREAIEHTMRGFAVMRRASARSEFDTAVSEFRQALTTAPSLLVFEW
jgi:hypothetical protein